MTKRQPRMPYGFAKRIVNAMRVGDIVIARPAYVVPLHNAARRLGAQLAMVRFERDGAPLYRVLRVAEGWRSGHVVCRRPRRDDASGRWMQDDGRQRFTGTAREVEALLRKHKAGTPVKVEIAA